MSGMVQTESTITTPRAKVFIDNVPTHKASYLCTRDHPIVHTTHNKLIAVTHTLVALKDTPGKRSHTVQYKSKLQHVRHT